MDTSPGCPSDDEVASLIEGTLSVDERARIQRHIDQCQGCQILIADAAAARIHDRTTHDDPDSLTGTRTPPLKKGTPVGRYIVLDFLGAGGMATVYAAFDPVLDRRVALKILKRAAYERQGPEFLLREARLVAQFAHPNVITVHDTGTFGDQVFLAMELVEGGTLRQWLAEPRAPAQIVSMLVQAGRGLAAAHAAGLSHRDFKPDNVLIGNDGRARVTDFGLAGPTGHPSSSAGTPAYMAPEQMAGDQADARADIFSFCVTLYEALYQERPFAGDTITLLSAAISAGALREPPRDRRVSPALHKLIVQGLAADPAARPPSLGWLLDRMAAHPRQRRVLWAAGALVVLAAAAGIAGERMIAARASACSGATQLLDGVWDASQRDKVRVAFLATGVSYAATSFASVSATLNAYAHAWTATRVAACEATRLKHTQPEEAWVLAAGCLDERRRALATFVDVLSHSDAGTVEHAVTAVGQLADVGVCGVSGEPPFEAQAQPAMRAQLERATDKADRAQTLSSLGKDSEARPLAEAAMVEVRALGLPGAEAYVETVLAFIASHEGDFVTASTLAWSAFEHSQRAHNERQVIQALKELSAFEGATNPPLAVRLSGIALATVARYTNRPNDILEIKGTRALALVALGKTDEALADLREVLTISERVGAASSPSVLGTRINLALPLAGQGRFEEARVQLVEAAAGFERSFGATHPETLLARLDLGSVLLSLGRLDEATPVVESVARDIQQASGRRNRLYVSAITNLGELRIARGQFAEGAKLEEEAVAIRQERAPNSPNVVEPLTQLGLADVGMGHAALAIPLLERALALSVSSSPTDLALVQRSLAKALAAAHRDPVRAKQLLQQARKAWLDAAQKWGGENRRFADECTL